MTVSTAPTSPASTPTVTVDIWSDVVCPWCYIGKRRFASGLDEVRRSLAADGAAVDFEVNYHAYQLDPTAAPGTATPVSETYAKKFGGPERAAAIIANVSATAAEVGLDFHLDRALRANTLLAHRLIWLAGRPDSPVGQEAMKERLLQAYFTDGLDVGDPDTLADCAADVGFDRAEIVEFLASDRGTAEVAADLRAAHDEGITAVPTYVINGRWAIPGAQEPETFAQVLRKMADRALAEQATPSTDT
jgi:predicted DsbA family dithiol-disulfide isomerase